MTDKEEKCGCGCMPIPVHQEKNCECGCIPLPAQHDEQACTCGCIPPDIEAKADEQMK